MVTRIKRADNYAYARKKSVNTAKKMVAPFLHSQRRNSHPWFAGVQTQVRSRFAEKVKFPAENKSEKHTNIREFSEIQDKRIVCSGCRSFL